MRAIDAVEQRTRHLHHKTDGDVTRLLEDPSPQAYRWFLCCAYGFVAPLERALSTTSALGHVLDPRRLRKHMLLRHDLLALGLRMSDIDALPLCTVIPAFDDPCTALGWAYVVERNAVTHPTLFRRLAMAIPGEVAFASSYLKCYSGSFGESWNRFANELDRVAVDERSIVGIVRGAKTGLRAYRRWRDSCDGRVDALSMMDDSVTPVGLQIVAPLIDDA